jgi:hypothetical protein
VAEKIWNFEVLGLFLRVKKSRGLGPQAMDHVRPWSTVDHSSAAWSVAACSLELGLRALWLTDDSRVGGVRHGGLAPGLTGAQKAVEQRRDGGDGGGGGALSVGLLRARREGREGWGRSGEETGCQGALL